MNAVRRALAALAIRLWRLIPPGYVLDRDLPVDCGAGRSLRIHIARRRGSAMRPTVAFVFGGGWEANGPDQGLAAILGLALLGYAAACIDYRLSGEATFPAQLEDVRACITYLRANAARWSFDPDRIGVIGLSSGGHLAALLGTTSHAPDGSARPWAVQAVAAWSAPVDLRSLAEHHGGLDSRRGRTARLLGGPVSENPELVAAANPLTYADSHAPPFLLVHGGRDDLVPADQGRLLFEGLQSAGVRAEFVLLPGRGHGFLGLRAIRDTLAFFDRELKRR